MSRRQFSEVTIRDEGQATLRYRLTCGSCGCGEALGRTNFGPQLAQEQVPQKFEAKGWTVGKRQDGRDDRCPSCVNRDQEARRRRLHVVEKVECVPMNQTKPALVPATTAPASVADKPRQPTRDERRVIFSKLEDVYVDEKAGYSAGWNDARVASDLGVPRAWVSEVRDMNFGPGISEEVERALAEARAVTAEAVEFRKAMDALTARGAEILKRADAIERTTKRIETAVR